MTSSAGGKRFLIFLDSEIWAKLMKSGIEKKYRKCFKVDIIYHI